jgi:enoyl-CoA hydratase
MDEAVALAELITANGPLAIKAIKQLVKAAATLPPAEAWALQAELQPVVFGSADAKEGATAFIERRPPRWQGR